MSNKQSLWRQRSSIFWRLRGQYISPPNDEGVLTESEKELLKQYNTIGRKLIESFINSSRPLGFNSRKRCIMCEAAIPDDFPDDICPKCKEGL